MIKNGTRVIVDGVQATVQGSFASGRHRQYELSDGRIMIDLHIAVEKNIAKVLPDLETPKPKERRSAFRSLPKETDDYEE